MATFDIRHYAEAGARARLLELVAEAERIRRAFPGIGTDRATSGGGEGQARLPEYAAPGGRRPMTAAERSAVSARMKAYWARRRRAKAEIRSEQSITSPASKRAAVKRGPREGGSKRR